MCVYDGGRLVKRATAVEPTHRLVFDVIDQVNIEDKSIRLINGCFEFEAVGEGQTGARLSTRYTPKLTPRWLWRPKLNIERHMRFANTCCAG